MKEKNLKIFTVTSIESDVDGNEVESTFECYDLTLPPEFEVQDVKNLLESKYPNKHIEVVNGMFCDSPWNNYIYIVNKKICELDNSFDAQIKLINKTKIHAYTMGFDKSLVTQWYNSQLELCISHFINTGEHTKDMRVDQKQYMIREYLNLYSF